MQLKPPALFLFALQCMAVTSGGSGPPAACCQRTFDVKMNITQIVAYTHQDLPLCPIKAVRFITASGRSICSDPESHWAKWAIQLVDTRRSTQAPSEDLSFIVDNLGQELIIIPEHTNDDPMVTRRSSGIGPPPGCCRKITNMMVAITKIVKYVQQDTGLCPLRAVRFTTLKNNVICSDPESNWTKFAMCVLDTRKSSKAAEAVVICRGLSTVNWTKPPMTTTHMPVTSKSTASTMFATSTEMRTTTLTTVTTAMSQTPPVESEASTSSMTTSHTVTSKKTPEEPTQQFPSTTIPPAQRSTPTVTVPSTHSPSLTSTQTQNPSETSTITTAASKETPKVTRLPWTLRDLKKKSKSGLRRAQKRIDKQ